MSHLKYILSDTAPPAAYPLSALTTEDRDVWAELRQHVVEAGKANTWWY